MYNDILQMYTYIIYNYIYTYKCTYLQSNKKINKETTKNKQFYFSHSKSGKFLLLKWWFGSEHLF